MRHGHAKQLALCIFVTGSGCGDQSAAQQMKHAHSIQLEAEASQLLDLPRTVSMPVRAASR